MGGGGEGGGVAPLLTFINYVGKSKSKNTILFDKSTGNCW